jgi:hypothetical protein
MQLALNRLVNVIAQLRSVFARPAILRPLVIFLAARVFLSLWAVVALAVNPLPAEPDEALRPYRGEPPMTEGVTGLLLGPWQRFDTLRYLRIARQGYAVDDSVFPPLYPLAICVLGDLLSRGLRLVGGPAQMPAAYLLAGLVISNLACLGSLILLYRIAETEMGEASATRTLVYLLLFPTAFFLMGAYTEPVFLFLVLGSLWTARRGHAWPAGILGGLAALTRLTGWVLVVPLSYEYLRQRGFDWRRIDWRGPASLLPPLALAGFLGWRGWAGLPPIAQVYVDYWRQWPGWPWTDVILAVRSIGSGQTDFVLIFNLVCAGLLIATTIIACRRLPPIHGLYMVSLLFFTMITSSEGRPLNALSRYTLVFFPAFMVLGQLGHRAWTNRLILYPSIALFLYFSGQFFVWGWIA